VNVDATIELADAAYHSECSKFVFVSTSHVYDVSATGSLLTEDSPVLPRGHYALQKFLAEEHLRTMFAKQPERLLIARLFSIIDDQQPAGTLGGAIRALLTNEKANLANTSDERDFLTPRQAANLLHACARNHDLHGVVNVCSGRSMTVRDITELMMGSRRFSELKDRILNGFSSAPSIVGSNEKLRSALADDASHLAETFEKNIRNVFAT
jgi:nucleoside-diphosphate-sugar epimerase